MTFDGRFRAINALAFSETCDRLSVMISSLSTGWKQDFIQGDFQKSESQFREDDPKE